MSNFFRRLNGVATPWGGLSWRPPVDEKERAQSVLDYLGHKRILLDEYQAEVPLYCVLSIIEIRNVLTEKLEGLSPKDYLYHGIAAIRRASVKFLQALEQAGIDYSEEKVSGLTGWNYTVFCMQLGEFRATAGIFLASIAESYKLHVPSDLEPIFPK